MLMRTSLLSLTAPNEDEAANDIDGIETASLEVQVAHLTAKQPDSDLLAAIAQDLDVREKTGSAISDGLAGILTFLLKDKLADEKIQLKLTNTHVPRMLKD